MVLVVHSWCNHDIYMYIIQACSQVHWYLYLNTISTTIKVLVLVLILQPFFHFCTVLVYLYSSTKVGTYKYLNTCKYFEVPLSPFNLIHQSQQVNPTLVHVEGSLKPYSKKSETLFSFMPDPKTEPTPFSKPIQTQWLLSSSSCLHGHKSSQVLERES